MSKGMNSLCGVIHDKMGYNVRLGNVFIFINRQKTTMKLLHAEDGGLVLYIKRLEEGTFRLPAYDQKNKSYSMQWRDLVMMVEGINDEPAKRLKRLKGLRKSDGYAAYNVFEGKEGVCLVGCLAHIKRHYEVAKEENRSLAEYVLAKIQKRYRIEQVADVEKVSPETRMSRRQEQALPILDEIEKWMEVTRR